MTKYFGVDSFPPGTSPYFRQFWLRESVPILAAMDRLKAGDLLRDDVFPTALLATGSEEAAREIYFEWLKARVDAGIKVE